MNAKFVTCTILIVVFVFSMVSLAQPRLADRLDFSIDESVWKKYQNIFSTYSIQHKMFFLLLAEKYTPARQVEWEIAFQVRETLLEEYKESAKGKKEIAEIRENIREMKILHDQFLEKEIKKPEYLRKMGEYREVIKDKMLLRDIRPEEIRAYQDKLAAVNRELYRALENEDKITIAEILTEMLELEKEKNVWLKRILFSK
jgi:hypothetical protein